MSTPLRILLLEDIQTDAELNEHLLRKAGIAFTSLRVETRAAFVAALDTFRPDIILADYKLPEFDGMAALQIVRRDHPEVPVIIVTGVLSDIDAVELIHAGAKDYMLKDRPARLAAAVQRALSIEQGIRARKAAELALRESEEKFRAIFENAKDGIVLTDAESGLVADCNAEFERQCGRPLAQIKTLHIWELRPPELQDAARRKFEEIRTTGHGSAELGFQRSDGTFIPAEIVATRVRIGNRNYVMSISRDITKRKLVEEKLLKSEAQIKAVLESLTESVVVLDTSGNVVSVNDAATKLFGRTLEELIDPKIDPRWKIIHSDGSLFPVEEQPAIVALRTGASVQNVEMGVPLPDGTFRWVLVNAQLIRDSSGTTLGVVASSFDVTERKQVEERYRTLIDAISSAGIMLFLVDDTYRVRYMNRPMIETFGDAVGKICYKDVGGAESPCSYCRLSAIIGDHSKEEHYQPTTDDGRTFDIIAVPYVDTDGKDCKLEVIQDITERKQAEAKIDEQLNELRRWYDATLGQGMRNIELKREVNELLKQAGQPPRYPSAEQPSAAAE